MGDEGHGCLGRGQVVNGEAEVCLTIERQPTDVAFFQMNAVAQDGALGIGAVAAEEHSLEPGFKVNEPGALLAEEQGQGAAILDGSAAESKDDLVLPEQGLDGGVFDRAEPGLAVVGKEPGDGAAVGGLDLLVDIEELPAEKTG